MRCTASVLSALGALAAPDGMASKANGPDMLGRTGSAVLPSRLMEVTPRRAPASKVTGKPERKLEMPEKPQPRTTRRATGFAIDLPKGSSR